MGESIKNTFGAWLVGTITPERLFWLFTILLGFSLTTGYHLYQASSAILANTKINIEQDDEISSMDAVQRQYAIDINTLTINQRNIEKGQDEIKQLIRNLP